MTIENLKQVIANHKYAVLVALITSFVVAFPQLYFRIDHPEFYKDGIQAIEMLPDAPWSARLREVQDGHPSWGNMYHKEGKDDPYLFQPLGSIIVAYTGMALGLEINNTILFQRLFYSAVTFLIMYGFVYIVSRNKHAAVVSVATVLLAEPVLLPSGLMAWLRGDAFRETARVFFLELARPVNSAMIFIFLFGFFVAYWQYYRTNKWAWGVLSAVLFGLNFYNYFYSWTAIGAFGAILYVIFLFQKKWGDILKLVYIFCGGLIVAAPYLYNLYTVTQHPNYEALSLRHGVIHSTEFHFIGMVALVSLLLYIFFFPRNDKARFTFGLAMLLTPFVTLNQQVITGKILQEGHYHWYMHKPTAIMFAAVIFFYYIEKSVRFSRYKTHLATAMVAVAVAIGFTTQLLSYRSDDLPGQIGGDVAIRMQEYAPVMAWLNANGAKESVVFGNEELSHVVVVYTPLNVFHHRSDQLMMGVTDQRLEDIVFTYYRLRNVDTSNVRDIFNQEKVWISSSLFGIHYREREGNTSVADLPSDVFEEVIRKYIETLSVPREQWIYDMFTKYEVAYLVKDKKADASWDVESLPFLKKEVEYGDMGIYSFDTTSTPARN